MPRLALLGKNDVIIKAGTEASTRDSVLDLEALYCWKLTLGTVLSSVNGIPGRKSSMLYDNYVVWSDSRLTWSYIKKGYWP